MLDKVVPGLGQGMHVGLHLLDTNIHVWISGVNSTPLIAFLPLVEVGRRYARDGSWSTKYTVTVMQKSIHGYQEIERAYSYVDMSETFMLCFSGYQLHDSNICVRENSI